MSVGRSAPGPGFVSAWMDPFVPYLYLGCLVGAIGLYLILRPGRSAISGVGALLGLGAAAWLVVAIAGEVAAGGDRPNAFFYIFALIAVAAAVRMITHHRPVYAALYFVLVVLASAGLFLLLEAEFLAFALIIVYAGAILITYLFVLMLAQQASEPGHEEEQAEYDVVAREPLAASAVGFLLLGLFCHMIHTGAPQLAPPPTHETEGAAWSKLEQMPRQLAQVIQAELPGAEAPEGGFHIEVDEGQAVVRAMNPETGREQFVMLPDEAMPQNVQAVGVALVAEFPASLELAGVILLMAMFGAVVLARRQIEFGEDETRQAAGLRRLDFAGEEERPTGGDNGR